MSDLVSSARRQWVPAPQEGVELCILHSHEDTREVAALIWMERGAKLPQHGHAGGEHMYVLEGCARVAGELVRAGDYHHTMAGESHDVAAPEPCLILSVLPKALEAAGS